MATVEELRKEAAERNIEGRSSMSKPELEKAIAKSQAGDAAPAGIAEENAGDPQPGDLTDTPDTEVADAQAAGGTGVQTTPTDRGVMRPEDMTSEANRIADRDPDSVPAGGFEDVDGPDGPTEPPLAEKRPSKDGAVREDSLTRPPANAAEAAALSQAWAENPNDSSGAGPQVPAPVPVNADLHDSAEGVDLTPDPKQRARVVALTDGSVAIQVGSVPEYEGDAPADPFEVSDTIVLGHDAANAFFEDAANVAQEARTARAGAIANRRTQQTVLG